jgi:PAS domain S-box-containing protein
MSTSRRQHVTPPSAKPPDDSRTDDTGDDLAELVRTIFAPGGFADDVPMAVTALDTELNAVGWNRGAEKMFGMGAAGILGSRKWLESVEPGARETVVEIFQCILAGGEPVHNVNENITGSGKRIVCEWHNAALRGSDGSIKGIVALARDVTAQHKAEREKARLRDIAALANAARDRDEILLLIRSTVLDAGGFDRAGIWLHDEGCLRGSWGTDFGGCIRDEHHLRVEPRSYSSALADVISGRKPFVLSPDALMMVNEFGDPLNAYRTQVGAIGLFAHGKPIGVVFFDNAITSRPITEVDVEDLLPFCEQVAVALSNAQFIDERARMVEQQQRLMQIAAAVNQSLELEEVLHMVRDGIVVAGGFERAGVFTVDTGMLRGSWGTDVMGRAQDERGFAVALANASPLAQAIIQTGERYLLEDMAMNLGDTESEPTLVRRALISLKADGEVIGLVSVDNLLSRRPATNDAAEALLPFCEQAAVAIRNARLVRDRERTLDRQRRLIEISAAINRSVSIDDLLRLVRDSIVEAGLFDRVGVWTYDHGVFRGAWGTDAQGKLRDERTIVEGLEDWGSRIRSLVAGDTTFYIESWKPEHDLSSGTQSSLPHAVLALRTGGDLVGVLSVDNMLSGRQICEADVEGMLPFAEQAAIAIRNAQLQTERENLIERQRRLASLAAAISARTELNYILRMVRDAIVEVAGFDRAGVFLYNPRAQQLEGAWGTDRQGNVERTDYLVHAMDFESTAAVWRVARGEEEYALCHDLTAERGLVPSHRMHGVHHHATVAMKAGDETVGIIAVDNLLTNAPITSDDIAVLLPFAEQAAVAIQNAKLQAEREKLIERQRRLGSLAAAISGRTELNDILRMVRDAIVEVAGFDRAGVCLYNKLSQQLEGTWGTDRQGNREESSLVLPIEPDSQAGLWRVIRGETDFALCQDMTAEYDLQPDDPMHGVHCHAAVAMKAGGEIVGVVTVDNLLTNAPITPDDVAVLLPFSEQAAVAIQNARLWDERETLAARQVRLANLSSAVNARMDLNEILRMVRDAAVETAGFDRAGVFLYDTETSTLRGTWGTDLTGHVEDIAGWVRREPDGGITPVARLLTGDAAYIVTEDYAREQELTPDNAMYSIHAHAVVKLASDGQTLGVLTVDNALTNRPIKEEEVQVLLPFTNQAAVAIQNARLFEQLHKTQEALVRAERLRALGELAGGVAHNINNLLTAVLGYSELIQQEPDVPAPIAHYARIIERAGLDGAEIVRRVRQFAQNETAAAMEPFDLAKTLREALDLTRPLWRNHADAHGTVIKIETNIPSEVRAIGIGTEIREVVVNVIKNALEAMPEGGTLGMSCRVQADQAIIEVSDTGVGMDEATRKRVFEPFFTTKGVGIGTGLGLSLAWGIIRRHGGRIEVESAPGEGTRFRIQLPLAHKSQVIDETPDEAPVMLHGVRILLVEDEEVVAESVARLLITRGATVALAETGDEALEWLAEHADICDIVLSDHGMPGMTGLDMLARIRDEHPRLRRILLSGWGASPPGATDVSAAECVLTKPIRQRDLLRALHDLARRAPS